MWAYQPHFRLDFETRMNGVLRELGVPDAGAECLLVGARIPGCQNPNGVCVEPDDGKSTAAAQQSGTGKCKYFPPPGGPGRRGSSRPERYVGHVGTSPVRRADRPSSPPTRTGRKSN